ncbi:MAG: aminoacyl-tRNA hydrolase [Oscillospiraceae bacterium]|nr:aminoacyl-tRNA hydrolase [Oscillospiraceae bacterium]
MNKFNPFNRTKNTAKTTSSTGAITHLIVGLGNPGAKYTHTRHNAGFWLIDYMAQEHSVKVDRVKFRALCGEIRIGDTRALLMKPQTFMNLSGESVRDAANFYKIPPQNILAVVDDANFEVGGLRIRASGSDGGHNGLKNMIYQLKSDQFPRLRVGVGKKPHPDYDIADWVLAKMPEGDLKKIYPVLQDCAVAIELLMAGELELAMGRYNRT